MAQEQNNPNPQQQQAQAVPGATATSAPTTGSGADDTMEREVLRKLLTQASAQSGSQLKMAPMQVSRSYGMPSFKQNMLAGAASMFVPFLGKAVQMAIAKQKQSQIDQATAEYNALNSALEKANQLAGGDPQKAQQLWMHMPEFQALFDPHNPTSKRRLKEFAKVFSTDWLNPEKSKQSVYYAGLQRHMQLNKASKLVDAMHQVMQQHSQQGQPQGQGQQPEQPPTQGQPGAWQPGSEQYAADRLTTLTPPNMQQANEVVRSMTDLTRAQTAAREKYTFMQDWSQGGRIVAVNKSNPADSRPVTDQHGNALTGKPMAGEWKPALVDQIPIGVTHNGKVVIPGSPEWTPDMQKTFDAASKAYQAHVQELDKRMALYRKAYMDARLQSIFYDVIDTETGQAAKISGAQLIASPQGRYIGTQPGMQIMNRGRIFSEIRYSMGQLGQAIDKMPDSAWDPQARATIAYVLKSADPHSAMQTFLQSSVAGKLTDEQLEYVATLESMEESAMSMRSIGGMGQGSDMLREAILRMIPGAGVPSKKFAQRQMQLLTGQINQLVKSVPKMGQNDMTNPNGQDDVDKAMEKWLELNQQNNPPKK